MAQSEADKAYEEKRKDKNGIWRIPKPNYDTLPQTTDVKINKRITTLSQMYADKKFSDLLDMVRSVTIDKIVGNL